MATIAIITDEEQVTAHIQNLEPGLREIIQELRQIYPGRRQGNRRTHQMEQSKLLLYRQNEAFRSKGIQTGDYCI